MVVGSCEMEHSNSEVQMKFRFSCMAIAKFTLNLKNSEKKETETKKAIKAQTYIRIKNDLRNRTTGQQNRFSRWSSKVRFVRMRVKRIIEYNYIDPETI